MNQFPWMNPYTAKIPNVRLLTEELAAIDPNLLDGILNPSLVSRQTTQSQLLVYLLIEIANAIGERGLGQVPDKVRLKTHCPHCENTPPFDRPAANSLPTDPLYPTSGV